MDKHIYKGLMVFAAIFFCALPPAFGADVELAEDSTLEGILKRGKLRVGLEPGYMPFEMVDKRGGLRQRNLRAGDVRFKGQRASFIGFDIDIAREMAAALGVKFVPVNTSWPSIIPALNLGRFDIIISGMSVTEERKKKVDFANPYMTIGQTILLNEKHKGVVKSYKDLNDPKYTVTSKPATTGEQAVKKFIPNCTYKPFDAELKGAMAVLNGDADAFVYDMPYNVVFVAMHGADKLVFLDEPFTTEPLAWAVRKNDPDFLKWLNGFLVELKKDGRYDKIYNKWFKSTDWFRFVR
ncbi:MAG: transporter substrate-binding domain-containing protein [Desulfobacterales bacterium]|nr:transporter substrate-binding domain-containing protein [Desulfobacterales bacterium]